jgi:hypothetical protein
VLGPEASAGALTAITVAMRGLDVNVPESTLDIAVDAAVLDTISFSPPLARTLTVLVPTLKTTPVDVAPIVIVRVSSVETVVLHSPA